jgi:hypothetical protein
VTGRGGGAGTGTAGTTGAAGSTGGGGAGGQVIGCSSTMVIDDMEDADDWVCKHAGRSGDWWSAKDKLLGTIDPPEGTQFQAYPLGAHARTGSAYGMRLSGTGLGTASEVFAVIGFNLVNMQATDVRGYQGVSFWAKSISGSSVSIRFDAATTTTTDAANGGSCTVLCFDHYHKDVVLPTSWQQFNIAFVDLVQEGWGTGAKDLQHVLWFDFMYKPFTNTSSFDFLIDDVSFY